MSKAVDWGYHVVIKGGAATGSLCFRVLPLAMGELGDLLADQALLAEPVAQLLHDRGRFGAEAFNKSSLPIHFRPSAKAGSVSIR